MRACGACFYFVAADHEGGECFNRPPHGYVLTDAEGGMSVIAIRPPVNKNDFCGFFSHKAQPKNQVGSDG